MAVLAMNGRNKLWFGTLDRAEWLPTPNRGADVSPTGWADGGTFLNGGGYQRRSFGTHKTYNFEWPPSSALKTSAKMESYFNGSFGRGLIYLLDPLTWHVNVLPSCWAAPSQGVGVEGVSLLPGVEPIGVSTSSPGTNALPVRSAFYDLGAIDPAGSTTFEPVITNYAPPLSTSGSVVEVRRNIALNPYSASSGATILLANDPASHARVQGASSPAPHPQGFSTCVSYETVVANPFALSAYDLDGLGNVRPEAYLGVWVYVPVSGLQVRFFGDSGGSPSVLDSGTWTFVTSSSPISANSFTGLFVETVDSSNVPVGTTVYATGVCELVGERPTETIAGGRTPSDPDFLVGTWAGAVNNSESIQRGVSVAGVTPDGVVAIQSSKFTSTPGESSIRLIPKSDSSNVSYAIISIPSPAQTSGTVVVSNHQEGLLTGSLWAGRGRPYVVNPSTFSPYQLPNASGTIEHRIAFGPLSSIYVIVLPHGGLIGSGDVWYSLPGIFSGPYSGPSFGLESSTVDISGETLEVRDIGGLAVAGRTAFTQAPKLDDSNSVFIPIPDGHQIHFGGFYTASGSAGVFVSPVARGGAIATAVYRLSEIPLNSSTLFTQSVSKTAGEVGVRLWLGKSAAGPATLTLTALHARISALGAAPGGEPYWIGGQGNSGVQFQGPPTLVNFTGVAGGQVSFAASFREVGTWGGR